MNTVRPIRNEALSPADLPLPNADWGRLSEFALTFLDAEHGQTVETCDLMQILKTGAANTLTELRAFLFATYRGHRHSCTEPRPRDMPHLWGIVERIRHLLSHGEGSRGGHE